MLLVRNHCRGEQQSGGGGEGGLQWRQSSQSGAWLTPGTGGPTLAVLEKARDLFKEPWPIVATFGFSLVRDQRSPGVLESRERTCLQCRRHRFNFGDQENPLQRGMAIHSSVASRFPWMEETSRELDTTERLSLFLKDPPFTSFLKGWGWSWIQSLCAGKCQCVMLGMRRDGMGLAYDFPNFFPNVPER